MTESIVVENSIPRPEEMPAGSPEEVYARAWVYYGLADYAAATEDFQTLVAIEPDNTEYQFGLGMALKSGQQPGAREAFEKALQHTAEIGNARLANVLTRLILAQLHHLETGQWNLEELPWEFSH